MYGSCFALQWRPPKRNWRVTFMMLRVSRPERDRPPLRGTSPDVVHPGRKGPSLSHLSAHALYLRPKTSCLTTKVFCNHFPNA